MNTIKNLAAIIFRFFAIGMIKSIGFILKNSHIVLIVLISALVINLLDSNLQFGEYRLHKFIQSLDLISFILLGILRGFFFYILYIFLYVRFGYLIYHRITVKSHELINLSTKNIEYADKGLSTRILSREQYEIYAKDTTPFEIYRKQRFNRKFWYKALNVYLKFPELTLNKRSAKQLLLMFSILTLFYSFLFSLDIQELYFSTNEYLQVLLCLAFGVIYTGAIITGLLKEDDLEDGPIQTGIENANKLQYEVENARRRWDSGIQEIDKIFKVNYSSGEVNYSSDFVNPGYLREQDMSNAGIDTKNTDVDTTNVDTTNVDTTDKE